MSADGTGNMTGPQKGAVTRIVQELELGSYRVWCSLHQLDLSLQKAYTGIEDHSWLSDLTEMISHLRRQYTLNASMGSKCPLLALTRWSSMGQVTIWLLEHQFQVRAHYQGLVPPHPSQPTDKWWVICYFVEFITKPVRKFVAGNQGERLILSENKDRLIKLVDDLIEKSGTERLESEDEVARFKEREPNSYIEHLGSNHFGLGISKVAQMMERNQKTFVIERLENMPVEVREEIQWALCGMILTIIAGISQVNPLRNNSNAAINDEMDPCLPQHLMKINSTTFANIVIKQRGRYAASFENEQLAVSQMQALETEFADFKKASTEDVEVIGVLSELAEVSDADASFGRSWENLKNRYLLLCRFCGGLASAFPHTATVESDCRK